MHCIDRWISKDFGKVCGPGNIEPASYIFGGGGLTPNDCGNFNAFRAA
jgi:hypothetical protein